MNPQIARGGCPFESRFLFKSQREFRGSYKQFSPIFFITQSKKKNGRVLQRSLYLTRIILRQEFFIGGRKN